MYVGYILSGRSWRATPKETSLHLGQLLKQATTSRERELRRRAIRSGLGRDLNQMKWATPNTMDHLPPKTGEALARNKKKGGCKNLREDVNNPKMNWPTPRAGNPGSRKPGTGGKILAEEAKIHNGLQDQEKSNTLGKNQGSWPTPQGTRQSQAKTIDERQESEPDNGDSIRNIPKSESRRDGQVNCQTQSKLGGESHAGQRDDRVDATTEGVDAIVNRVDRLRLLGNGVVPQTAELAWRTLWKEINKYE